MNSALNNDALEAQLNATRIKLYEQTKDMTTEQRVAFFNRGAKEILAKHGVHAKFADDAGESIQSK